MSSQFTTSFFMFKIVILYAMFLHLVVLVMCDETAGEGKKDPIVECKDAHHRCNVWADLGECVKNEEMRKYCAKSCDSCNNMESSDESVVNWDNLCLDADWRCSEWADNGECDSNPIFMLENCRKSCGDSCSVAKQHQTSLLSPKSVYTLPPGGVATEEEKMYILNESTQFGERQVADGSERRETLEVVRSTILYMKSEQVRSLPFDVRDTICRNQHELCSFWSGVGECENNKKYMDGNCAPACKSCHLIENQ